MTIYAIDFDGTVVEHEYPHVGPDVPGAVATLQELVARGDELILWTMRSGPYLAEAIAWFEYNGIALKSANSNPDQGSWTASPKAYAHVYIDDAALGCPLIRPTAGAWKHGGPRPYVDWAGVRALLELDALSPDPG